MARIRIEPQPTSSEYHYSAQTPEDKSRELVGQLLEAAQMGYTHKIEGIIAQIEQVKYTPRELEYGLVALLVANHKTKRGPLRKLVELGHAPHEALIPALLDSDAPELVNFMISELGADPKEIRKGKPYFSMGSVTTKKIDPCYGPFWDALTVLINHGYVYRINDEEKEWLENWPYSARQCYVFFFNPLIKYLVNTLNVNCSVAMAIANHPEGWNHNILRLLVKTKHALTEDQRKLIQSELVARELGC